MGVTANQPIYKAQKRASLGVLALATVLTCGCRGSSAPQAFLTRTSHGAPLKWHVSRIEIAPIEPARSITGDALREALADACDAWNHALEGCGAPRLLPLDAVPERAVVAHDHVNSLAVRAFRWCPDDAKDGADCYDPKRTALTHLYPRAPYSNDDSGAMAEADIEINAVNFEWAKDNFRAVVAHELGHVLGLDHSCNSGEAAPSLAPACSARSETALMAPTRETHSGSPVVRPSSSERDAVCSIYRAD